MRRHGPFLVTGAAGFIGSTVVDALLDDGARVTGLDVFDGYYAASIKRDNLRRATGHHGFRLEEADVRDAVAIESVFRRQRPRQVLHFAAKAGVRPSMAAPESYRDVNVGGTANVLAACAEFGVDQVVLASSSSVYGDSRRYPFRESEPCGRPLSPYGDTKADAERLCAEFTAATGTPVTCLRLFTVYGPRQRPDLAIHRFVRDIESGMPVRMFGDGTSRRDYTYVDDVVAAVLAAARRPAGFRCLNIAHGTPVSLVDVVRSIERALGVSARVERFPTQSGDLVQTWADVSAARRELGFAPAVPFSEGIDRFVAWWRGGGRRVFTSAGPADG